MIKKLLITVGYIMASIIIAQGQIENSFVVVNYNNAAQNDMRHIAGKYCRSNPYKSSFNSFLHHLVNDPTLKDKEQIKKTDSTLYSFSAFYTRHQPFALKSQKVQVSLWEESVLLNDSLSVRDTLVNYILSAYYPNTATNQKNVKKIVKRIFKKAKPYFAEATRTESRNKKKELVGGGYNMFLLMHGIAPLGILWDIDEKSQEIGLHLVFRIRNRNNRSETPVPLRPRFGRTIPSG